MPSLAAASTPSSTFPASSSLRAPGGTHRGTRLWPRLWALLLWASVGVSVGFWATRSPGATSAMPTPPPPAERAVDSRAVAQALGAAALDAPPPALTPPAEPAPWVLTGVIAAPDRNGAPTSGVALLARPGERSQPVTVGAVLDGGWRVSRIEPRRVVLTATSAAPGSPAAAAGAERVLELPPVATP